MPPVKGKPYMGPVMAVAWMAVWMNGAEHEPVRCPGVRKEGAGIT